MRHLFAFVIAVGVPISVGYAVACGPPDSFNHISDGKRSDAGTDAGPVVLVPDDTLDAPRPIAPLSNSWINGSRPHFRWEAGTSGAVGAQVIVCPDRKCTDPSKTKTWSAAGLSLDAPEDLPPGHYFWHLVSTSASGVGSKTSPTWSMLVRGGAGDGQTGGSIADFNGDGIADLIVSVDVDDPTSAATYHDALVFLGTSFDDPVAVNTQFNDSLDPRTYANGTSSALDVQAVDINGDGVSDAVFADLAQVGDAGVTAKAAVFAFKGGSLADFQMPLGFPALPGLDAVPRIAAPGDIDGDGYGDVLVGTKTSSMIVFGSPDGLSAFTFGEQLDPNPRLDAGMLPNPTTPIAINGGHLDNDGRIDVAIPSFFIDEGFFVLQAPADAGIRNLIEAPIYVGEEAGVNTAATAFAFGDIDGDGTNDLGFITTSNGKMAFCVVTVSEREDGHPVCWTPPAPPAGFGSSLIAADLEGDGKDEFLLGSAGGGVDVLRLKTATELDVEHLAIDFGLTMTVLDPGRPKPAVWAATRADGTGVAVFQGKEQKRVITVPEVSEASTSGPVIRFQAGIR